MKHLGMVLGLAIVMTLSSAIAAPVSLEVPKFTHTLSGNVKIGDLNNPLSLDMLFTPTISLDNSRIRIDLEASAMNFYPILIESLKSKAGSGCSVVLKEGRLEAKLCRVHWFSIALEPGQKRTWLRGEAKMRYQIRGIGRKTTDSDFVVEMETRIQDGHIIVIGKSANVEDIPGEVDRVLANSIDFRIPLPDCLLGSDVKIESLSLPRDAPSVTLSASLPIEHSFSVLKCSLNAVPDQDA